RVHEEGLENIPDDGPCVLVCNHVSYVDAAVIAACVPRPVRFVMDHRIFRAPLLSFIFRAMRTIPIASASEDPRVKERAYGEVEAALAGGEIVGIFPEGRLTHTGEMNAFRPGGPRLIPAGPLARGDAHRRRGGGAGGADGAAGALGEFFLALAPRECDAQDAGGLFPDFAR